MKKQTVLREIARLDNLAGAWARAQPIVPMGGVFDDIGQATELEARIARYDQDIANIGADIDALRAELRNLIAKYTIARQERIQARELLDRLLESLSNRLDKPEGH